MSTTNMFAILAPVPEMHFISGLQSITQLTNDPNNQIVKVAFGIMDFELFRRVDELRENNAVDVFIYASHAANQSLHSQVTWHGRYIGHVNSRNGRYPGDRKYRPQSTNTDQPIWAIYWELDSLQLLNLPIAIASLKGLGKSSNYTSRFVPEGPLLIEYSSNNNTARAITRERSL
jgi:hypothetical protein